MDLFHKMHESAFELYFLKKSKNSKRTNQIWIINKLRKIKRMNNTF